MTPSTSLASPHAAALPRSLVVLLACGAGVSVAGIYYNQPILHLIEVDLKAKPGTIGLVPTVTQLGYSFGILLLAPLGDRFDRRKVIVWKCLLSTIALVLAGIAPSVAALCGASFAIGLLATIAQDFVPAAATLAAPSARGKAVGSVMTGLLVGILLSRVVSGAVAKGLGWRAVFFGAAASIAVLGFVSRARLPPFEPTTDAPYASLLASMAKLFRESAVLRRAAIAQAFLAMSFSAFWSTLALALAGPPHELGSAVAGSFGLAGAAGAIVAPIAGSAADRRGPDHVIRMGAWLVAGAFVLMGAGFRWLPVVVVGTVLFDLGVQACLISHQTIVYGLEPSARSRLNAVLVSIMFVGMALGSALGAQAFARWGFSGVAAVGVGGALAALFVRRTRLLDRSRKGRQKSRFAN